MIMKANTKNKKSNPMKKIVPAAGMLAISATMLATSTYAWFTMSREVEVQNIQMTATTPEDIQLCIGTTNGNIQQGTGVLSDNTAASTRTDDWGNTVDFSTYYTLGKIIPASSNDGESIFFTPDAAGNGKYLKDTPRFYQADGNTDADITGATGDTDPAMTTLHINTTNGGDGWVAKTGDYATGGTYENDAYTQSTAWNNTNDDGYYVDIPVWLRTSSTAGATLSVDGYITIGDATDSDSDKLYQAVRVSVLNSGKTDSLTDLVKLRDSSNYTSGTSIVDFMTTTHTGDGVSSVSGTTATYGTASKYDGSAVISLAGGTGTDYGTPTQVWIRVWLEGEDPNCWNENAGQDFKISLKFTNGAITPASDPT
jgi:hypothetical protein